MVYFVLFELCVLFGPRAIMHQCLIFMFHVFNRELRCTPNKHAQFKCKARYFTIRCLLYECLYLNLNKLKNTFFTFANF